MTDACVDCTVLTVAGHMYSPHWLGSEANNDAVSLMEAEGSYSEPVVL